MPKLPGPLRLTPSFPFAGRSKELATLRALIPAPEGEGLRFALVGGEAGSGKSRLVREFAGDVGRREVGGDEFAAKCAAWPDATVFQRVEGDGAVVGDPR